MLCGYVVGVLVCGHGWKDGFGRSRTTTTAIVNNNAHNTPSTTHTQHTRHTHACLRTLFFCMLTEANSSSAVMPFWKCAVVCVCCFGVCGGRVRVCG